MGRLFLPFTPNAIAIEKKAIGVKAANGYGPYDGIDPRDLASRMGVRLIPASWFDRLTPTLRDAVLIDHSRSWSAGTLEVDGETHVLLNPSHSTERQSPTLAEELVHVALGHPASTLQTVAGVPIRTCRQDVESEAYAVGVAMLVPYRDLFNHVNAGGTIDDLPVLVPLSDACKLYRIKMAGLWRLFQSRQRAG